MSDMQDSSSDVGDAPPPPTELPEWFVADFQIQVGDTGTPSQVRELSACPTCKVMCSSLLDHAIYAHSEVWPQPDPIDDGMDGMTP